MKRDVRSAKANGPYFFLDPTCEEAAAALALRRMAQFNRLAGIFGVAGQTLIFNGGFSLS